LRIDSDPKVDVAMAFVAGFIVQASKNFFMCFIKLFLWIYIKILQSSCAKGIDLSLVKSSQKCNKNSSKDFSIKNLLLKLKF